MPPSPADPSPALGPASSQEGSGGKVGIPTPKQIAKALAGRVVGQRAAIREISLALSKKLAGLPVGNVLMIGSSGTGKTTLMRSVEAFLTERPALASRSTVIRIHANVLGEEAVEGRSGETLVLRLLERAREQLGPEAQPQELVQRAAGGIVFVDEVDKIRSHVAGRPNTTGIRAQEALLTVMENEAVPVNLPDWAGGRSLSLDSSGILFVGAGAFEGLYDAVYDRVTIGRDKGALKPVTVVEEGDVRERLVFSLRDWLRNEDLFDYGMSPQFLSRFDAVVLLRDLGSEELRKIFLSSADSSLAHAHAYFEKRGYRLTLADEAIGAIVEAASRQPRLGARALRETFRRVIRDYEFDPAARAEGPGKEIHLGLAEVQEALRR